MNNELKEYCEGEAEKLKLKGYTFVKSETPFLYAWRSNKRKNHYIRLCRVWFGDWTTKKEYWNLETDFVPFNYKHNHRENANIKGDLINPDDLKQNISEFDFFINRIKNLIKVRE